MMKKKLLRLPVVALAIALTMFASTAFASWGAHIGENNYGSCSSSTEFWDFTPGTSGSKNVAFVPDSNTPYAIVLSDSTYGLPGTTASPYQSFINQSGVTKNMPYTAVAGHTYTLVVMCNNSGPYHFNPSW